MAPLTRGACVADSAAHGVRSCSLATIRNGNAHAASRNGQQPHSTMVRSLLRGDKVEGEDGEAVDSALGAYVLHPRPDPSPRDTLLDTLARVKRGPLAYYYIRGRRPY